MTLVSVVIPVFQGSQTIADALNSVLGQTYTELEIIVVDDGSIDQLDEVLQQFEGKITLIKQKNRGAAAARNNGIRHAKGELIAFLDADDYWLPERLTLQLPLLDQDSRVGLVFGNAHFLSEGKIQPKTFFDLYPPYKGEVFPELFACNFIPMPSVIVRRQALDAVGFFDESVSYVEDYELWLRIARTWRLEYVPAPVVTYRLSSHQISKNLSLAASVLLQVKERIYHSNRELLVGTNRDVVERGYYNKYLRLALCLMRDSKREAARTVLDQYSCMRGVSPTYFALRLALNMPQSITLAIIRVWDKFYQKPELGFV